jgi:hypothetical protein
MIFRLILMTQGTLHMNVLWLSGRRLSRAFIRNDVNMLLAVTVLHSVWPGNRKHGQRELFSDVTWAGVTDSKRAKLSRRCHQGHLHRFAWWGVSRRYRTTQQFSLTLALVMGANFCFAQDALQVRNDDLSRVPSGTWSFPFVPGWRSSAEGEATFSMDSRVFLWLLYRSIRLCRGYRFR